MKIGTVLDIKRIELEGLHNTRDLGGFITLDGRKVRSKRLIRSGELFEITENDKQILTRDYNLKVIVDFRTGIECAEKPDPQIEGVRYVANSILPESVLGISREEKTNMDLVEDMKNRAKDEGFSAVEFMASIYSVIAMDPYSRAQYKKFFDILLNQDEGAVLWHCSAGKDRVGTGTALLLSALGVSRENIIEDYLKTNEFWKEKTEEIIQQTREKTDDDAILDAIRAVLGVNIRYIESVFSKIDENFGSIENYLETEMGIDDEKRLKLQGMYLE